MENRFQINYRGKEVEVDRNKLFRIANVWITRYKETLFVDKFEHSAPWGEVGKTVTEEQLKWVVENAERVVIEHPFGNCVFGFENHEAKMETVLV